MDVLNFNSQDKNLFAEDIEELYQYKLVINCDIVQLKFNGWEVIVTEPENKMIMFKALDIFPTCTLTAISVLLYNEKGILIHEEKFKKPIQATIWDVFKIYLKYEEK